MLGLIGLGISVARALFVPLMLMAVLVWVTFARPLPLPWQTLIAMVALAWAVWTGYAGVLVIQSAQGQYPMHAGSARLVWWSVAALVYTGVYSANIYACRALLDTALILAVVPFALAVTVWLLLPLMPVLAVIHACQPLKAAALSFRVMAADWRRPAALLALPMLATVIPLMVMWGLDVIGRPEWDEARRLVHAFVYSALMLPAIGTACALAFSMNMADARNVQPDRLPKVVHLMSAVIVPALLGATLYFVLHALVPISLQTAWSPSWDRVLLAAAFLPVGPIDMAMVLVPALIAGCLAQRESKSRSVATMAGVLYGLIYIHVRLGSNAFEMISEHRMYLHLYVVAILTYGITALVGGFISPFLRRK